MAAEPDLFGCRCGLAGFGLINYQSFYDRGLFTDFAGAFIGQRFANAAAINFITRGFVEQALFNRIGLFFARQIAQYDQSRQF